MAQVIYSYLRARNGASRLEALAPRALPTMAVISEMQLNEIKDDGMRAFFESRSGEEI